MDELRGDFLEEIERLLYVAGNLLKEGSEIDDVMSSALESITDLYDEMFCESVAQ